MNTNATAPRAARGFTMVEALVALVCLSIGLLGVASLQMAGLQSNLSSSWRSQATYLSYDIIDRMRANREERVNYVVGFGGVPAGTGVVAVDDLAAWKANLAATLPGGDGTVAIEGLDNTVVTITVRWTDSRDPAIPALQFVTRSRI